MTTAEVEKKFDVVYSLLSIGEVYRLIKVQ